MQPSRWVRLRPKQMKHSAERWNTYAYGLGLVFQIVDDVLDVTSTPEQLGKPIGSDSENGKTTFVTLYGAEGAMKLAHDLNRGDLHGTAPEFWRKSCVSGTACAAASGAQKLKIIHTE